MKNDKPVIFDLSVRWKPAQDATRPLQQPSADNRPKFDFPGFTPEEEGGVGGLPAGYTFEEFTICVDGEPETRWWPTWTDNPEA